MNRLKISLVSLLIIAAVFNVCNGGNETPSEPITIKNGSLEQTVPADATSAANVTGVATAEWTTSLDPASTDWLTVYPASGGKGEFNISFTLEPNPTVQDRKVKITITCNKKSYCGEFTQKGINDGLPKRTLSISVLNGASYNNQIDKLTLGIWKDQTVTPIETVNYNNGNAVFVLYPVEISNADLEPLNISKEVTVSTPDVKVKTYGIDIHAVKNNIPFDQLTCATDINAVKDRKKSVFWYVDKDVAITGKSVLVFVDDYVYEDVTNYSLTLEKGLNLIFETTSMEKNNQKTTTTTNYTSIMPTELKWYLYKDWISTGQ